MIDRARFLVIAFDGLRPDMVGPELTPNLCRLQRLGTTFTKASAVFPTDTRANVASLVTGLYPRRHGIMGNAWYDAALDAARPFDTADAAAIERADALLGGRLFDAPTLGQILAEQGRSLAVIGTASTGTTRLLHHTVRAQTTHLCVHCHEPEACSPVGLADEIVARFGPMPPATRPDLAAVTYAVDVFLQWAWPRRAPDVTILWLNEPDTSYHWFGVGSDEAMGAIRHTDREFGRILDWWLREGRASGLQLLAMSDHGQIDAGVTVDPAAALEAAGLRVAVSFADGADVLSVPGYPLRLYARDGDPAIAARAADALLAQAWCGQVLTAGRTEIDRCGAASLASLRADHPRAPDLCVTLRHDAGPDRFGWPGRCPIDAALPYAGNHGGLSPQELSCLAILAGALYRSDASVDEPSSMVDLMPTLLAALGVAAPPDLDGAVLRAALRP